MSDPAYELEPWEVRHRDMLKESIKDAEKERARGYKMLAGGAVGTPIAVGLGMDALGYASNLAGQNPDSANVLPYILEAASILGMVASTFAGVHLAGNGLMRTIDASHDLTRHRESLGMYETPREDRKKKGDEK